MKSSLSYPSFMKPYFELISEEHPLDSLKAAEVELKAFLEKIPGTYWTQTYAPGKWSVAQVLGHMNDTERIFSYRSLCIARGEQGALPGFDENAYAGEWVRSCYSPEELVEEALLIRRSTILLYSGFSLAQWAREGEANAYRISPAGLAFATVGHQRHHLKVLQSLYLV
jgi:hypothetical protein